MEKTTAHLHCLHRIKGNHLGTIWIVSSQTLYFEMYYFITRLTIFSECWCNGLLNCVPFTYKKIFVGYRYTFWQLHLFLPITNLSCVYRLICQNFIPSKNLSSYIDLASLFTMLIGFLNCWSFIVHALLPRTSKAFIFLSSSVGCTHLRPYAGHTTIYTLLWLTVIFKKYLR